MKKAISLLLTLALLAALPGCGETREPTETTEESAEIVQQTTAEAPREPQVDLNRLRADLDALTENPRPVGSQGEQAAADYLESRFAELGCTVTRQSYTDAQGRKGSNIIAVREAPADADILVLSAHHDSAPGAYGANDNASGAAALLAAAELLKDAETDTELRFISFTDEENGKNGSRLYTASLTEEERERMIGCIQLDMLGGLGTKGAVLATADGQGNWLTALLREKDPELGLAAETASDHTSFQLAGVPSVLVMQAGRGYLYHSAADKADQLDLDAIAHAAAVTAEAAGEIIDPKTPSIRSLAREQGRGYTYCQTRQNVIHFDASRADTEGYIGAAGELAEQWEEKGAGWTDAYETYRYAMRWFNGKNPMNTYYCYRNGFLQSIEIRPCETGYNAEQVRSLITAMYGEPISRGTNLDKSTYEGWQDGIYGKYITLTDGSRGCTVSVSRYSVGISNVLGTYPVRAGQAEISDPEANWVWEVLCSILPEQHRQKITRFQLFSDGASNILAYTSPIVEKGVTDNSRFSITVDYYDVFDENGEPRDWSKLTYTILHEYGHVLLEDETQIDLTLAENTHDPAGFIEGSFRKEFYDRFWARLGASAVQDFEKNPTNYVSRYGANLFHEDIADTFAIFVLGGRPEGKTVAEEKLLFFWADPEMTALRREIRQSLGLPQ